MPVSAVAKSRFTQVAEALGNEYGVERGRPGRTHGPLNLLVDGKVFARISPGHDFVVRLPQERIKALVAADAGRRLSDRGSATREWLVVRGESVDEWTELAREALRFVRSIG